MVTVIVLTTCPAGLRGHLTRWLLEISAGVFIGNISARVRELLWAQVIDTKGKGRALLVYSDQNEQRLSFAVHEHHWQPVDYDGVTLIRRPASGRAPGTAPKRGWSKASHRRRSAK